MCHRHHSRRIGGRRSGSYTDIGRAVYHCVSGGLMLHLRAKTRQGVHPRQYSTECDLWYTHPHWNYHVSHWTAVFDMHGRQQVIQCSLTSQLRMRSRLYVSRLSFRDTHHLLRQRNRIEQAGKYVKVPMWGRIRTWNESVLALLFSPSTRNSTRWNPQFTQSCRRGSTLGSLYNGNTTSGVHCVGL